MGLPYTHPKFRPALFLFILIFILLPEVSRCQIDSTEIKLPLELYFETLETADSSEFANDFEYPFLLVLEEKEKSGYFENHHIEKKKAFIREYILRQDKNPILDVNHWFLEFAGRYDHAKDEFGIDDPPYFDMRGEYWIRYGEPWSRIEDSGGSKNMHLFKYYENIMRMIYTAMPIQGFFVKPNESWYYISDRNDFVVHFVKNGKWKKVERLEEALLDRRERNVTWQWMELIKERDALSPDYFAISEEVRKFEDSFKLIMVSPEGVRVPSEAQKVLSGPTPHYVMYSQREDVHKIEQSAQLRSIPEVDTEFEKLNRLDFYSDIAQFRGDSGNTIIETVILQPVEEILREWGDNLSDTVKIKFNYLIRDQELQVLNGFETEDTVLLSLFREIEYPNVIKKHSFSLPPDSIEYTYQVKENRKDILGFNQKQLKIRDFSGDELHISDIAFYYKPLTPGAEKILPLTELVKEEVSPYPFREIDLSEPLYIYFELYNLNSLFPSNSYEIEIKISTRESRDNIFKRSWNWIRRAKRTETSLKFKRSLDSDDAEELIVLNLNDLKKGDYDLWIFIRKGDEDDILAEAGKTITLSEKDG